MVAELALLLVAHLVLTALPGVAAALHLGRRGVEELPILLAVALVASGLAAMLSFWAFYLDPWVGKSVAALVALGAAGLVGFSLWRGLEGALLRGLAAPAALWCLGSAFLVFLGFAHGGTAEPLVAASSRFSHALPGDNYAPAFFADWFYVHGHGGSVPIFPGEWLSSDRPPLQSGFTLSQRPFGWDTRWLNYQVLGVVLQQLWIVGLWALLVAAGVRRLTAALTLVAVLLSSLAIVNGFFVWPKLLPAAMLLAAAALVLTPLWGRLRKSLWGAALVAALCALAMLGHGSSAFGILALSIVAAYRGLPSWRWLGVGAAVAIVLMAPWSAYQKYGDPPGNRLAKWTLAGETGADDRGTVAAVADAYREVGISGAIDNRVENLEVIAGIGPARQGLEAAFESGDLSEIVRALRLIALFYLLPSFGLLLLAPLAMAGAWRRRGERAAEWSLSITCLAVFAVGVLLWWLILFGGPENNAVVYVTSYLLPLLAIVGAVVGLRASLPRFAVAYVGLASLLSLAVYVPALDPMPGTAYSVPAFALSALSLVAFALLALGASWPRSRRERVAPAQARKASEVGVA